MAEKEKEIVNPKDIFGEEAIEEYSPTGDELNPDVKPSIPKKIELNTELQSPEAIAFFKRLPNGNNALIDYEADSTIIASYGNIENVVRKILVPKFGYGEYIPARIEYDKKTRQKSYIYGKSIFVLEPNSDKPVAEKSDSSASSLIMELLKREDEKDRQRREEFNELIRRLNDDKNNHTADKNNNDSLAMIMQQQNNQMLIMMKMMFENMNGNNSMKDVLSPIVSKIEELEEKVNTGALSNVDIPETKSFNQGKDIIELITAIKNILGQSNQDNNKGVDELIKEVNSLKEKITQNQFEQLKKEIEYLKNKDSSSSDEIDEFITRFQQIKKMSTMIDGKSDGFTDILGGLVEQLPDMIDKITKATPNVDPVKISKLEEENKKLREVLTKYNQYIKSIKQKKLQAPDNKKPIKVPEAKQEVKPKSEPEVKQKINQEVKPEQKVEQKQEVKKEVKKRGRPSIIDKYISSELITKLSNSKTDEEIIESITNIIGNLLTNSVISKTVESNIETAMNSGSEGFRDVILKYVKFLRNKLTNYNAVVDCINRRYDDWYQQILLSIPAQKQEENKNQ